MSPLRKEQSRAFDALSLSLSWKNTQTHVHTHTHITSHTFFWYHWINTQGIGINSLGEGVWNTIHLRVLIRKNMPSQGNQTPCQETALHKRRQHVNTNVWSVQTGTCWEDHKLAQMLQLRVHRWQEMGPEWRQFEDRLWRDAHGPSKPWALFYTVEKPVHGVQV